MLKDLSKLSLAARRRAAAWRRWFRKLPHNRVCRPRVRDADGRTVGHGPPVPMPEPQLPPYFCEVVRWPSGRVDVKLTGEAVETAYRLARRPQPTADAVGRLPLGEAEIRRLHREYCCE
jgi:hypothetical protein